MKTPCVIKLAIVRTPAVAAVAAFSSLGIVSGAVLVDSFESGYTLGDVTGQTGGTGWSNAWSKNGADLSGQVIASGNNITGQSLELSSTTMDNFIGAVNRTYDVQPTPYYLQFQIQINNLDAIRGGGGDTVNTVPNVGNAQDYFQIFDRGGNQSEFGGDGTWLIRGAQLTGGQGGVTYDPTSDLTWNLFNYTPLLGNGFGDAFVVDTGIELVEGNIYDFAINIWGGGTWSASISNGTEEFHSGILGFRSNAALPSRNLHFGIRDGGGLSDPETGMGSFTVDNLALVPEPATALLGALGLLAMLRRRRG